VILEILCRSGACGDRLPLRQPPNTVPVWPTGAETHDSSRPTSQQRDTSKPTGTMEPSADDPQILYSTHKLKSQHSTFCRCQCVKNMIHAFCRKQKPLESRNAKSVGVQVRSQATKNSRVGESMACYSGLNRVNVDQRRTHAWEGERRPVDLTHVHRLEKTCSKIFHDIF
jgi:hypothetical protein